MRLSESSLEMNFRPSKKKGKGIKAEKGAGGEQKGFFAKLFGCCTSKKSSADAKAAQGKQRPEKRAPPQAKPEKRSKSSPVDAAANKKKDKR